MRDASGNVMAVYDRDFSMKQAIYAENIILKEQHVYGSSRHAVKNANELVYEKTATFTGYNANTGELAGTNPVQFIPTYDQANRVRTLGNKSFELTNHLGNVLSVISDRKLPIDVGSNGTTDYFKPEVLQATDYYAFGSQMPGRQYTSAGYRYGFNGKEKDDAIKGNGNSLDFGARIYDPRLGRWLSLDPQAAKYPFSSPYVAFGNNPNVFIDPGGETLKVAGSDVARAKFKTLIEKQFAGKITAQYGDFGVLHANVNEGATLTKSEMALFEQVMYKGITEVGVITGSEELRVGNNEVRTTENVIVGAFGEDMQILDLDDIEMFDKVGKTSDGLGATTAGSLGHEIAEANKWQQEGKALTEEYQSAGYAAKVAHEYGISVENKINGTERDTDENLPSTSIKGTQQLGKDKGSTNFGTMNLFYKTNSGTTKVSYDFNRDNVKNEAPKSSKVEK